ncbi:MAG: anhydro-N-acetylmuramic acid kinase [Pseudomonadota bacterium]
MVKPGVELVGEGAIWALGLMSGTSLDGVDAALLKTDGITIEAFGPGAEAPYRSAETAVIELIMESPGWYRTADDEGAIYQLAQASDDVVALHARAVADLLSRTEITPDLVGFHGQTVAHAPEEAWTWQLGDGAALARALNRPVVWDFRTSDMVHGGEGAPLAPFYHWALARHIGMTAPVAFVNIGGVANVTWVDPTAERPEAEDALLAFDTGPGNALLNDWMARRGDAPIDRDGAVAAAGAVDWMSVHGSNFASAYLARTPPKSLDRNSFAQMLEIVKDLSLQDGAATLTALTAACIAGSTRHMPRPPSRWLICGGGRKNPAMMAMLAEELQVPVDPVEAVGLDGDLLEAQAFAYLAVRAARDLPLSAPGTTGCGRAVTGGRLSYP